ncbi:DUF3862 domain-containing protein, partial [Clostridiaceae bacterium UIB06]|nr:DUF3862 domain-containing protein [Clostridiaceae bacterium UIB06]
DKFIQIKMGMTYEQTKGILGEGKEQSSSDTNGIKTIMYTWTGSGASNMNITFQNDKAINKTQLGLGKNKSDLTMDKYNKVQNGMSYDEIKAILGEGELTSLSEIMGSDSSIYTWMGSGVSNMNVTFQEGKSISKSQLGLK